MIRKPDLKARIHNRINKSRANGPGNRAVVWFQGCPFDCPGCFNPKLKALRGGEEIPVHELIDWITSIKEIEGISISGGEPTEQIQALYIFLSAVKERTDLSVLLFSGRDENEILKLSNGRKLITMTDVLIEGQYNRDLANPPGIWPSSINQNIRFLTDRYNRDDFLNLPETEIIITEQGDVVESGLGSLSIV